MNFNEYQELAKRTMPNFNTKQQTISHALHGMVSEVGEIHGLFQKVYQGHEIQLEHVAKEVGDLLWFVAEFCTGMNWDMSEVAKMNIEKLKARFPEGFSTEKSLNRAEGDV